MVTYSRVRAVDDDRRISLPAEWLPYLGVGPGDQVLVQLDVDKREVRIRVLKLPEVTG